MKTTRSCRPQRGLRCADRFIRHIRTINACSIIDDGLQLLAACGAAYNCGLLTEITTWSFYDINLTGTVAIEWNSYADTCGDSGFVLWLDNTGATLKTVTYPCSQYAQQITDMKLAETQKMRLASGHWGVSVRIVKN